MPVRVIPYRLPLVRPWVAASATLTERRGWLLAMNEDGLTGWGDCAPLPSANSEAACHAALAQLAATGALPPDAPPEACWALDTARHDLGAQRRGLPLAYWLAQCRGFNPLPPPSPGRGGGQRLEVAVNAALGALDAKCLERASAARDQGFHVAKIKVGLAPIRDELTRLREIAHTFGGRLRLDANRAWPEAEARRFLTALADLDLPIDAVEEPLAHPSPAALAALQAKFPYALAVDESLPDLGVSALINASAVRRFVLKPARLGGFAATQAIAQHAQAAGIEVVITSVVDSAIGVTAAAHLAAALAPDIAHGLGTSAWLAADVAASLPIESGLLRLAPQPGLGIRPHATLA